MFLQWNCRGFRVQHEELRVLVSTLRPRVVALQETLLRPTDRPSFRGYDILHQSRVAERASGGVALMIAHDVYYEPVPINSTFEVIAARVHCPRPITVASMYIPPGGRVDEQDLIATIAQLPCPFLLLGDFNAHHPLWGGTNTCVRGRQLETLIVSQNIVLLNTGADTHFNAFNGSVSALDLSFASPGLAARYDWSVHTDLCGSDHFPVRLSPESDLPPPAISPRWKLKQADWAAFSDKVVLDDVDNLSVEEAAKHFTDSVTCAAEASIPKTSGTGSRRRVPWWNDACRAAVQARCRALRAFQLSPTADNLAHFRRLRAAARRTLKESRRASWRDYVSTLNASTPLQTVWNKIKRIQGSPPSCIPGLTRGGTVTTDPHEVSELLASTFEEVSSSIGYDERFLRLKEAEERHPVDFPLSRGESYNDPFSMDELEKALSSAHDTSPGADCIPYAFLRHLNTDAKEWLLALYNRIWATGMYPSPWRDAIVIPIPKPGKCRQDAKSYRPISLTSCVSKTLEKMVNCRLLWLLEKRRLLSNVQCGFRHHRSTLDQLAYIEGHLQNAFLRGKHTVAVFFDLEKAYDTTWRLGILKALKSWGLRGNLPNFIAAFMKERRFAVRVGATLSSYHPQENGVPQGSVLSCTLFAVAINSIVSAVRSPVRCTLFVDDFAIFCSSPSLATAERQLQLTVDRLERWAAETGFRFSPTKTVCVNFSRRRGLFPEPSLHLGGVPVPVVTTVPFLGLVLDKRLSWLPHIRALKARCVKALNILKTLSGSTWGADRTTLLRVYRAVVRSKLDYGAVVYASARKSQLRALDTIHHTGIRISTGAFRTSPVESLWAEAGEPPLSLRRDYLLASYAAKVKASPGHLVHPVVWQPGDERLYERKTRATRPIGIRLQELLADRDLSLPTPVQFSLGRVPPWRVPTVVTRLDLKQHPKSSTRPEEYFAAFAKLISSYPHHVRVYTDGSRMEDRVGCGILFGEQVVCFSLPGTCSVYTAELFSILTALEEMQQRPPRDYLLCSDSLSAIQGIKCLYPRHPVVVAIQDLVSSLRGRGVEVVFCWVPGHVGLAGNEKADEAAKTGGAQPVDPERSVPPADIKCYVRSCFRTYWDTLWDAVPRTNKLRQVKDSARAWASSCRKYRSEEVTLARARIGHCHLTHGFLLRGEAPPVCVCGATLSVRHILVECRSLCRVRRRVLRSNDLTVILRDNRDAVDRLLNFLQRAKLFSRF
jgi:ribonuclease HI